MVISVTDVGTVSPLKSQKQKNISQNFIIIFEIAVAQKFWGEKKKNTHNNMKRQCVRFLKEKTEK